MNVEQLSGYEANLLQTRYGDGAHETSWPDIFKRVVGAVVTTALAWKDEAPEWLDSMVAGEIMPGSPQLWNYGAVTKRYPRNGSSCFTGRMGDTLDDFREADGVAEKVYVASGGFGLMLDSGRPRGTHIKHCSEGAMGIMCFGGPARRIEGTTGYITGSGRARGALMLQLGIQHPDSIEFILAKTPTVVGWLDDWETNARSKFIDGSAGAYMVLKFSSLFLRRKDWPTEREVYEAGIDANLLLGVGALKRVEGIAPGAPRLVPYVSDWSTGLDREANRIWDLPMQNCNMSVRIPDGFMHAVSKDAEWAFEWKSTELGYESWDRSDESGQLQTIHNTHPHSMAPKYSVRITTWEGIRDNMSPNKNHWRDTQYASFYRDIVMPAIGHLTGKIKAKQVWKLICKSAHAFADPGVVFSDTYERFQPVDSEIYGARLSNPCSEYVNSPGGSCNLASVNLRAAVCHEKWDHDEPSWDIVANSPEFAEYIEKVRTLTRRTARYLMAAMDHNIAPVEYIDSMTREHFRTIGVGVMGLAEALMAFHIRYGSGASLAFARSTMCEVQITCWEESFKYAQITGVRPKAWNRQKMSKIFRMREESVDGHVNGVGVDPGEHRRRWSDLVRMVMTGKVAGHTTVTSVAPTGTISMISSWQFGRSKGRPSSVTSGIEPVFDWGVKRQDNSGVDEVYHDLWYTPEHHQKPWMVTAMGGVSYEQHVEMQAAIAAFCCMSVSKTINLSADATVEHIQHAYELAWALQIPGTSVYRNLSKPAQVLTRLECPSGECAVVYPEAEQEAGAAK